MVPEEQRFCFFSIIHGSECTELLWGYGLALNRRSKPEHHLHRVRDRLRCFPSEVLSPAPVAA